MGNYYKERNIVPLWVWILIWSIFAIGAYIDFDTTRERLTAILIPTIITPIAILLNKYYD